MSGVAALFARGGAPADRALLARMIAAQRFRGPDGEGAWVRGPVALGHTRHATTLEAARETSPARLDDRLVLASDARLDARDELRARLGARAEALPADAPDAALILHAYDAWGEACLPHLSGDFSFALWDAARRRLLCAVDPLGARAFYYAEPGGRFVGANSLACVRLAPGVGDALDEVAVGDFIGVGCHQDRDRTIYAGIKRVPPGHCLVVDEGGARVTRYFSWPEPAPELRARPQRHEDCVGEFRELFGRAVRDRVRGPRLAITLSGGVDSPLVAREAKRALGRFEGGELRAYTAIYERLVPDDERPYAALAARALDVPIDFQAMDEGALYDWVGRLAPAEPPADAVLGPFLDQLERIARRSAVVLTGYDGDALLGAAVRLHWRERLAQRRLGALARELAWYVRARRSPPPLGVRTALARRRAAPPRRPPWLRAEAWRRADLEPRWARGRAVPAPASSRQASTLALGGPALGALLDAHDPGYLGRAIEFRHPLLDLRLVRFALRLPAVPWCVDKHLLRRCMDGLPAALRMRPKTPLAADPVAALVRRGDLGRARPPVVGAGLEAFVDAAALADAMAASASAREDPGPLLRAVSLAIWLEQRDAAADRQPSPHAKLAAT
jgi:asparagine synthase (glutamine-hydrolysing)